MRIVLEMQCASYRARDADPLGIEPGEELAEGSKSLWAKLRQSSKPALSWA